MQDHIEKLLFVCSNSETLASAKQLMDDEWDCCFAESDTKALKILESVSIDLIVADAQVDDTKGIDLLTEVRNLHPFTVRILLADQAKQKNIAAALTEGYTQQIIPMPWIDQEFKEVIRSALRQRKQQRKHSLEFQALINAVPLMPALPESYTNVRSCIVGDDVDIEKMSSYIVQDVAISTALLHWANSALFGQRFQVDTIKKAIIVLGTDVVENLILSESVNRTIASQIPEIRGFDLKQFKKHSMATAVISRLLIKSIYCSDIVKHDRAFISGLLHDMGKLAAATFFTTRFEKAIALARKTKVPLMQAEMEVSGSHHAELGAFLAEWWALPPFIANAINWHHQPQSAPTERDVISATYVANLLSYQFNYGSCGDTCERLIDEEYRDKFFLNDEAIEILKAETDKTISVLTR